MNAQGPHASTINLVDNGLRRRGRDSNRRVQAAFAGRAALIALFLDHFRRLKMEHEGCSYGGSAAGVLRS